MEKIKRKRRSVKEYFKDFFAYCKNRCKGSAKNITFVVLIALYTVFCLGSIIYFAILGGENVRDCFIGLSYIIIVPIFFIAEFNLHIRSPLPYTIFLLVFCVFCYLGASYNFYTLIPMLDDILHACWGVVFATLGFAIVKSLMGEPKNLKQFVAYVVFSVGFCMILSICWEIYEFTCDRLLANFDMQEDTIIHSIHSFVLHDPYDHLHTYKIEDIWRTVLYNSKGEVIFDTDNLPEKYHGYIDIGLIDTMMDIIWCVVSTCALTLVLSIDRALGSKLYPHIIPVYVGKEGKEEPAGSVVGEQAEEEQEGSCEATCDAIDAEKGEECAKESADSE